VVQNPNWPLIDEAVSFYSGPNSPMPAPYWVSVKERSEGSWTSSRGRQYELDQVQTGEANTTLRNTDGALDPDNISSPFYPQVDVYRAYRRRAQYPATVNILTADQATAGQASGMPAGSVLPAWVEAEYTPTIDGLGHYLHSIPASPTGNTFILNMLGWSVTPGVQFSVSCLASSTASINLALELIWLDSLGNLISLAAGSTVAVTTATTLTVTATAPANAVGARVTLTLVSGVSACTVTHSKWQIQQGPVTAYVQPSKWYSQFTGYVERWPQTWQDSGNYGVSDLTCIDAFGYLSQRKLLSPAYMELLLLGPSFFYPLDEPTGATSFADLTGARSPAGVLQQFGGLLSQCAAGSSLVSTAASGASGFLPAGLGGPVVTIANSPSSPAVTVLDLSGTAANAGPPSSGGWTRIFALRMPTAQPATTLGMIWFAEDQFGNKVILDINSFGNLHFELWRNGVQVYIQGIATLPADGGWHLFGISVSAAGTTITSWLDSDWVNMDTGWPDVHTAFVGGNEALGGALASGSYVNAAFQGWAGDIQYVSELPFEVTSAQWTVLYETLRYGSTINGITLSTDSGTRYADILRWAGWAGSQAQDKFTTGQTVRYGPPTDLIAAAADSGTDAVTATQAVVDTENGNHFAAADGTVTFKARRARYNQTVPVATFGENTAGGEIPYTVASFGLDPTRLGNDAAITQTSTGIALRVLDQASIADKGDVQLQRNVNTLDSNELFDAGTFLVDRYRTPMQRLETITIDLAAYPAAWAAILALELGSRVRVLRRPPNAPALTFDGFVEQINWTMTEQGAASVDLQISPAAGLTYWVAGSSRMTLKNAVIVGATSMVVNPLADAATNPIGANISGNDPVESWVIDWGTASAEYVTIVPPIPATGLSYTSATLQVGTCVRADTGASGTGFQFAHAIGATLQDIGGGLFTISSLAELNADIVPANALDQFATVGVSTIVGY
jgi:hypothetical protein